MTERDELAALREIASDVAECIRDPQSQFHWAGTPLTVDRLHALGYNRLDLSLPKEQDWPVV